MLDIVIPVYNEGQSIPGVLASFDRAITVPFRVLICYDRDDDDTLPAVKQFLEQSNQVVHFVKNRGRGAHAAVMSGIEHSDADFVLVYPADDVTNAVTIDEMVRQAEQGAQIVCACRFMPGGCMRGAPWLKDFLVRAANFTLHHLARLPARDASNGQRLFSRQVVKQIPIESTTGFIYSIEWLAKVHRLGWQIGEVPNQWYERKMGRSRFKVLKWLPAYLRWYFYIFATTYLGRRQVELRKDVEKADSATRS